MLSSPDMSRNKIPPHIEAKLLPSPDLSILEFLKFDLPIVKPNTTFTNPSEYFTNDPPTNTDVEEIRGLAIPPAAFVLVLAEKLGYGDVESIRCPHIGMIGDRFPPWTVRYWAEIIRIRDIRQTWMRAEDALQKLGRTQKGISSASASTIRKVYMMLGCVSWAGTIRGFSATVSTRILATYATRDWLTDEHESQMLDLLRQEIVHEGLGERIELPTIFFLPKLQEAFHDQDRYMTEKHYRWLRGYGQRFGTGVSEQLALLANINSDHWVALALDFKLDIIWYGDSMGNIIGDELREVLDWWIYLHTGRTFNYEHLPITRQRDGWSCGLLAWNALAVLLLKHHYALIDVSDVAEERLKVLIRVVTRHSDLVCSTF